MSANKKISIIGSGNIGGTIAYLISAKKLANVMLFDINKDMAQGKALDISQSCAVLNSDITVSSSSEYKDISNSDVIVVTAGIARRPGMSRDDLLNNNARIINDVGHNIKKYAPNAFVIVITNPLDAMVWTMQQATEFNTNKVVGMSGILDSARFNYLISKELNVPISDVKSFVLGGHGDNMIPLVQYTSVGGLYLKDIIKTGKLSNENIDNIVEKTRKGGEEIVSLLKTGSAFYTPASAAVQMIESYIYDLGNVLTCCCYLSGEYSYSNLYAGVPCSIGKDGVQKIIELTLTNEQSQSFRKSILAIEKLIDKINL